MMKIAVLFCLVAAVFAGPCDDKVTQLNAIQANAGTPLMGFHLPTCDEDGNFAPKQCREAVCSCVDKNGKQLGYQTQVWTNAAKTQDCKCAVKKAEYQATGMIGLMFNCATNGNYESKQCMGSVCYCVNSDGVKLVGTETHIAQFSALNC